MPTDRYPYPAAISRLIEGDTSREPQNRRAISWLLQQAGGPVVVVTPRKDVPSTSLKMLIRQAGVSHRSWRGFSAGALSGHRVLYAWPDRQHLNDIWGVELDALAVIEWGEKETADWIAAADPHDLSSRRPAPRSAETPKLSEPLPNGVDAVLENVARWAAGYSSGLKWDEEDKLKADMMNRPDRWEPITVEQIRVKCRELGMRPNDVDTIAGFLQRRKDGRRFNVRSTYRTYRFN